MIRALKGDRMPELSPRNGKHRETARRGLFFVEANMGTERISAPSSTNQRATIMGKLAWFRSSRFWVTRTRGNSRPARAGFGYESYLVPKAGNLSRSGLLGLKRSQAQHRQPMRMPLAGHHFARAFALALRTSTAQEAAMVQKELK